MWSKSTGAESLSWARRVLVRFPNPPLAVGELGPEESWQLLELHPSDSSSLPSMESNTCHFYLLQTSKTIHPAATLKYLLFLKAPVF